MTDQEVCIWGEPYGRMGVVSHLATALGSVNEGWPRATFFDNRDEGAAWEKWVANSYPLPSALLEGIRSFLVAWLGAPAREKGYKRWGLKEVRLGGGEAVLLKALFPSSRFVVLLRDPRDAWNSARRLECWWRHDRPVQGVRQFARNWDALARSWLETNKSLGHRIIRYEDIVNRQVDFRELEEYLQVALKEERALSVRVGSRRGASKPTLLERWLIRREAGQTMRSFGYR